MNEGRKKGRSRWDWVGVAFFLVVGIDAIRVGITGSSFLGPLGLHVGGRYQMTAGQLLAIGIIMLLCGLWLAILIVASRARWQGPL